MFAVGTMAAPLVAEHPDVGFMQKTSHHHRWVESASKVTDRHETTSDLCRRVLRCPLNRHLYRKNGEPDNEPVTEAINPPYVHVARRF